MNKAIIGKKIGMSQVFAEDGKIIPVTVVQAGPCPVVQIKTKEKDGYSAVKLGFDEIAEKKTSKPDLGQFKKANVKPVRVLKEFKLEGEFTLGQVICCTSFKKGDKVDVSGRTRGRGFTGVIQRWNQHRLKMTHGTGPTHREVGSMSSNSDPSRVFKLKKMPGRYGYENVTIQNLEVVKVDEKRNVLMLKGAVPGPKKGYVFIADSVKA